MLNCLVISKSVLNWWQARGKPCWDTWNILTLFEGRLPPLSEKLLNLEMDIVEFSQVPSSRGMISDDWYTEYWSDMSKIYDLSYGDTCDQGLWTRESFLTPSTKKDPAAHDVIKRWKHEFKAIWTVSQFTEAEHDRKIKFVIFFRDLSSLKLHSICLFDYLYLVWFCSPINHCFTHSLFVSSTPLKLTLN